jgi:hypothetical protein
MHGLEADQEVNMILDASSFEEHTLQTADGPTEVLVKARTPVGTDESSPILG